MESTAWYQSVFHFVNHYSGNDPDTMPGLRRSIKYWGFWNEADLPDGQYQVAVQGLPSSPPSYDLAVGREIFWGQTSFTVTVSAGH